MLESLRVWAHALVFYLLQRSERDACAACTVITLLRAPPRGPAYLEEPSTGPCRGWGTPGSSLPLLLASGEWGPPQPGAVPPRALTLLVPLLMLHNFEPPFPPSPFVVGWVLNYKC